MPYLVEQVSTDHDPFETDPRLPETESVVEFASTWNWSNSIYLLSTSRAHTNRHGTTFNRLAVYIVSLGRAGLMLGMGRLGTEISREVFNRWRALWITVRDSVKYQKLHISRVPGC